MWLGFFLGVNNFLTGVLWGREENGEWKWISEAPSLDKPIDCSQCTTYFKYLEDQIVKEASDRKTLRQKTGNFIKNEGARFRPFYDELIELLRYNSLGCSDRQEEDDILDSERAHDNSSHSSTTTTTTNNNHHLQRRPSILHQNEVPVNGYRSEDGTLYHYILPSFFRLIQYLQENKRDFVIYLRTMGDDSTNFLINAERVVSNEHRILRFESAVPVNHRPGYILRTKGSPITLQMKFQDDDQSELITDEFSIHEKLENGHGIHAIKDDFKAWCATNYHYTTSKPVWFDPDDRNPRSHHILFDDNFRVIDPNDSIVDIRIMNKDKHRCYSCPFEFYPALENVFAVQAYLYSILANPDYYVQSVQNCEENLDRLLQNIPLLNQIKQQSCDDH